jgi:hypothetical protein
MGYLQKEHVLGLICDQGNVERVFINNCCPGSCLLPIMQSSLCLTLSLLCRRKTCSALTRLERRTFTAHVGKIVA